MPFPLLGCVSLSAMLLAACSEAAAPSVAQPGARLAMCGEGLAEGCVQLVTDTTGLIYSVTEGGYEFRVLAIEDGAELQRFGEEHGNAVSGPSLEDLDQDGDLELIVPDFTGTVNTVYRIWQQVSDERFEPAGEVSGFDLTPDVQTGLIGISSRGSAVQYSYTTYVFTEDGLVLVYQLDTDYADAACVLTQGPAFEASGHDADLLLNACEAEL
ncbi:hypothetical protein ACFELO_06065 [Oceanicaulis sp. LC35]|uniref:hypothetical protein n=1 Tax=Oceanicaulis sp. LC35 TaxID=3349635 RepID=UPI003F87AE06